MLQKISIADILFQILFLQTFNKNQKKSTQLFSTYNNNNNNNNNDICFWAANQNIRMISEGSCDWSNDAKTQLWYYRNKLHFKIENNYFK